MKVLILSTCCRTSQKRPRLNIKTVFPRYGIPILKIRRSWDRLIFNVGIPIMVRRHLFIATPPPPPPPPPHPWWLRFLSIDVYLNIFWVTIYEVHFQSLFDPLRAEFLKEQETCKLCITIFNVERSVRIVHLCTLSPIHKALIHTKNKILVVPWNKNLQCTGYSKVRIFTTISWVMSVLNLPESKHCVIIRYLTKQTYSEYSHEVLVGDFCIRL